MAWFEELQTLALSLITKMNALINGDRGRIENAFPTRRSPLAQDTSETTDSQISILLLGYLSCGTRINTRRRGSACFGRSGRFLLPATPFLAQKFERRLALPPSGGNCLVLLLCSQVMAGTCWFGQPARNIEATGFENHNVLYDSHNLHRFWRE